MSKSKRYQTVGAEKLKHRRLKRMTFGDTNGLLRNAEGQKLGSTRRGDLMNDEYEFSTAKRGKFFREGAQLLPPVHLDPDVLEYFSERASARGISLSSLVNALLKKDIELIDAGK
jgi:hypothetical protein